MPRHRQRNSVATAPDSQERKSHSLRYDHPYLNKQTQEEKRELGMFDLFFFKMFRCFVPDSLPPPDPNAPVYQAHKKSSSANGTSRMRSKRPSSKSNSSFSTISVAREDARETFSTPAATRAAKRHTAPQPSVGSANSPTAEFSAQTLSQLRPASETRLRETKSDRLHAVRAPEENRFEDNPEALISDRVKSLTAMFENRDG